MEYFVTGATGFIGKRLVRKLLRRRGAVGHFLVREASQDKVPEAARVLGRLARTRRSRSSATSRKPRLGLSAAAAKELKGKIDHFFHLAAVYDLKADADSQIVANIDGTTQRRATGQRDQGRLLPARARRSPRPACTRACSARTCSTRPRTSTTRTSRPSTTRRRSCARSRASRGASTARASSSATAGPARWTRSTARTTSSS